MKNHLKKFILFSSLVVTVGFHWSCVKDTTTPAFITAAKKSLPGIPLNLYALVTTYHCANCHNPSAGPTFVGANMDLRTPQSCYASWVGVPAELTDCTGIRVIAGDAANSVLIRRLDGTCTPQMPFDGPPYMSASEIQQFKDWINQGANPE